MQQIWPDVEQQIAELRSELHKAREERDLAYRVVEVTEWKALVSANDRTTIETLEAELDTSREFEKRMLESLVLQTKQLELTKISLEEARIEMTSLQETVQKLKASGPVVVMPRGRYDRDLQRVHGELLLALAAEEKSKNVMEELMPALEELNASNGWWSIAML